MRITLVTETYAPQVNGVSRTLGELVKAFRSAGDSVQVIHPDYHQPPQGPNDVLVRSEAMPFYRELLLPLPPFRRVREALDRFAPDLVHIATEATLGLSMLRHASMRRLPVVSSFHTNFDQYATHYGLGWLNELVWRYLRWFHNCTLETYVPSRDTMRALEARGFERLVLWPRGVDCDLFSPDRPGRHAVRNALGVRDDQVIVGHVSRIAPEKNVDYLSRALEEFAQRSGNGARILIVGDGPSRPDLEARLGRFAWCVGYKTGQELADHYAACDVFVFASLTETFGNVILEAMASGLPVVALRAGGPADTVRCGETGYLVDPSESPAAMAARVTELVNDHALRTRMSRAARAYAESQSWDSVMRTLRARYERLVGEWAGTPASAPAAIDQSHR